METQVPFGSPAYWCMLALLIFARGMDFLSTWIATPNLRLEANPIAKFLGWKWGGVVNVVLCAVCARWPVPSVVIVTTSFLVAARNFHSAWMARALGEDRYRFYIAEATVRSNLWLHAFCVFGESFLTGIIGVTLIAYAGRNELVLSIGIGIVAYSIAVAFYTLLTIWRMRRTVPPTTDSNS